MNRTVLRSRVGIDGILHIDVPFGEGNADREVQVTIEPVGQPEMSREEWEQFVRSTAGSVTDPSFVRPEQGEYEQREELP